MTEETPDECPVCGDPWDDRKLSATDRLTVSHDRDGKDGKTCVALPKSQDALVVYIHHDIGVEFPERDAPAEVSG